MSRSIFVVANHRTGSSCLGGVLHKLGCHMGDDLLGAHPSNPEGHFEDREVMLFNDQIIGDWKNPVIKDLTEEEVEAYRDIVSYREQREVWGIKDPRLCITARYMVPFAKDPRVIIIERDRHLSALSLVKRDGMDGSEARRIIDMYEKFKEETFSEEIFSDIPFLIFDFELLIDDTKSTVEVLSNFVFDGYDQPDDFRKMLAVSFVNPDYVNWR